MFLDQGIFEPGYIGPDGHAEVSHTGNLFQHGTVVHRFFHRFAPGKWRVVAHQNHLHFFVAVVAALEVSHDLKARFVLIIAFDHGIVHWRGTRYVHGEVVGVGSAQDGDVQLGLGPGRSVGGMSMHNTSNVFPVFVQYGVGFGIRRGTFIAFHYHSLEVDNDDVFRFQRGIGYTAGFDGKDTRRTISHAGVAKSKEHQTQLGQLHIGFVTGFFDALIRTFHVGLFSGQLRCGFSPPKKLKIPKLHLSPVT